MDEEYHLGKFNDLISVKESDSNINTSLNVLSNASHPPPTIVVEFMWAEKHPLALVG